MQTMTTLEELHKDALKILEKAQEKNKLDFNRRHRTFDYTKDGANAPFAI
jgi:hypothetical protein